MEMLAEEERSRDLRVMRKEETMVPPCAPSPEKFVHLSPLDNYLLKRTMMNVLIVYNAQGEVSADPAQVIKKALSNVLMYYYPLAGRLRQSENGKNLHVECTGEGALFVEAMADNPLSVLGNLEFVKPSYKQLHFESPPDTNIEDTYLLAIQVTRFRCGGFVLGLSFHHSICDGRGIVQFLNALAEMARGYAKPSVEPIWRRDLLNPRHPPRVEFHHTLMMAEIRCHCQRPIPETEEYIRASLVISSNVIEEIKRSLRKESPELEFTAFDIVAALVWRERTKVLQIPGHHGVKLIYPADARKSFKPALPQGYYGNAIINLCAVTTSEELVDGSLFNAAKLVKTEKLSLSDEFLRSTIDFLETNPCVMDAYCSNENFIISDWRWLGFDKVDYGWGEAANMCIVALSNKFPNSSLLLPVKNGDGIKILVCMTPSKLKLLALEMQRTISDNIVREFEWSGGSFMFSEQPCDEIL